MAELYKLWKHYIRVSSSTCVAAELVVGITMALTLPGTDIINRTLRGIRYHCPHFICG